jgi:hypothetical protein
MPNQPQYIFVPPPNWPATPAGWTPPEGWQPDPSWGPAPDGWEFWQLADAAQAAPTPPWAAPPVAPHEAATPSAPTMSLPEPGAVPPAQEVGQSPAFTALPAMSSDSGRSWFARHKVLSGIAGAFLFLMFIGAVSGSGGDEKPSTEVNLAATDATADDKAAADKAAADKSAADKAAADKAAADKAAADKAAADKAAADKAAADKAAAGPPDQQALLQAVIAGREGYESTDNELKQRQAQRARKEALRAAVPNLKVQDWVGEIRSIDTNGEGKAVLELSIGADTKVATWNNALSDIGSDTLISMDSPMYETLVTLEKGDRVRFSGSFFSDDEQGLEERSLTFHGQMKTPNFVFRFSSIKPL